MEIKQILKGLKAKGFTVQAIERELGFSNGSLGKTLSTARMDKLLSFYESKCGDGGDVEYLVLKGGLKVRATDANIKAYLGEYFKAGPFDVTAAVERQILQSDVKFSEVPAVIDGKKVNWMKEDEFGQMGKVDPNVKITKEGLMRAVVPAEPREVKPPSPFNDYMHRIMKIKEDVGAATSYEYKELDDAISGDPDLSNKQKGLLKTKLYTPQ